MLGYSHGAEERAVYLSIKATKDESDRAWWWAYLANPSPGSPLRGKLHRF